MTDAPARLRVLPTGFEALDGALGGGIPRGTIVELFGPELPPLIVVAQSIAQTNELAGVLILRPGDRSVLNFLSGRAPEQSSCTPENALEQLEAAVKAGKYGLVLLDCVNALAGDDSAPVVPGSSDDAFQRTLLARRMSMLLRSLTEAARRNGVTVVFLNQSVRRESLMPAWCGIQPTERTAGGNALKYYASIRLDVRKVVIEHETDSTTVFRVKVVKNRFAPPFTTCDL